MADVAMIQATFSDKRKTTVRYQQRVQELGRAVFRAERENAAHRKQAAITLSSGPYTTEQLQQMRKMNGGRGPYSRVSPMPPAPPFIVNKQSQGFGSISQMWQTRLTTRPDGTIVTLYNTSPHAKMLFGTVHAIPRPLLEAVTISTRAECFRRLAEVKSKALR